MKYIKNIITAAGTALSIIGLAFSAIMPIWLIIVIVLIGLGCFAFLLYDEIKSNTCNERICKSKEDIEIAMKDIINSEGNICIMSRDLSWITHEVAACLVAKKDSVLIFAQSENATTKELTDKGIDVKYYGNWNFNPKTRFTIIRYNKNDPQVAIANMQNSIRKKNTFRHTIYQTGTRGNSQDEWINSLAIDLISLCSAVCEDNQNVKEN